MHSWANLNRKYWRHKRREKNMNTACTLFYNVTQLWSWLKKYDHVWNRERQPRVQAGNGFLCWKNIFQEFSAHKNQCNNEGATSSIAYNKSYMLPKTIFQFLCVNKHHGIHTQIWMIMFHMPAVCYWHIEPHDVSMHLTPFFVLMWVAPLLGSSNFKCKWGKGGGRGDADWKCGITHLCLVWPVMVSAEL